MWAREVLVPVAAPTVRPTPEAVNRVISAVFKYAYETGRRDVAERLVELLGLKGVMQPPD